MTISLLRRKLKARLTTGLRERDRPAAAALRSVLAALENAEALPVRSGAITATSKHVAGAVVGVAAGDAPRRVLTDAEEREVVDREVAELRAGAEEYDALGAADRAEELRRAATLIGDTAQA